MIGCQYKTGNFGNEIYIYIWFLQFRHVGKFSFIERSVFLKNEYIIIGDYYSNIYGILNYIIIVYNFF